MRIDVGGERGASGPSPCAMSAFSGLKVPRSFRARVAQVACGVWALRSQNVQHWRKCPEDRGMLRSFRSAMAGLTEFRQTNHNG